MNYQLGTTMTQEEMYAQVLRMLTNVHVQSCRMEEKPAYHEHRTDNYRMPVARRSLGYTNITITVEGARCYSPQPIPTVIAAPTVPTLLLPEEPTTDIFRRAHELYVGSRRLEDLYAAGKSIDELLRWFPSITRGEMERALLKAMGGGAP